jgi:putative ABC transport system permease protein
MSPGQTLRVAGRAILRNKLRAFLTCLGIIIGVGAVIAMMAFGAGAKARVEEAFSAMGTNLLIVLPGSSSAGGVRGGFGTQPTLTWDDLAAIRTELSSVKAAAPSLRTNQSIVSEEQNWTTSITGTSPDYFEIRKWPAALGSVFSQSDIDGGSKVIVLGATVSDRLFGPNANPVGQSVRIQNAPFTVVAVLIKKGQSPNGQDYDDAAFMPYTTFAAKISKGIGKYLQGTVFVEAVSSEATPRAEADVRELLRQRHRLGAGQDDDFSLHNLSEIASAKQEGADTMTTLLAGVAAVSLVVGGIGIMNIMLVSVTERTREIGIRMAVGAKPHHIMSQFLVEALTLAVAGGVLGALTGLGVAAYFAKRLNWPMKVQPEVIAVAFGFSALVGVVFGLYPAWKASKLDPIDALRYE